MPKRKKIVINSSEDVVKPKIIYNSAKLSQYFNVKDHVPQKKSDLVYKCTCPQINCNESYIGESERCFEERIIPYRGKFVGKDFCRRILFLICKIFRTKIFPSYI